MSRGQAEISTDELAANFENMVNLPVGWPTGFPSGGELGPRPEHSHNRTATTQHGCAQPQLNKHATDQSVQVSQYRSVSTVSGRREPQKRSGHHGRLDVRSRASATRAAPAR